MTTTTTTTPEMNTFEACLQSTTAITTTNTTITTPITPTTTTPTTPTITEPEINIETSPCANINADLPLATSNGPITEELEAPGTIATATTITTTTTSSSTTTITTRAEAEATIETSAVVTAETLAGQLERTTLDDDNLHELLSPSQMEKEATDIHGFPIGSIPEPIQVLDDIISEFDDGDASKPIVFNSENHSEDDGYMSLSRKNMNRNGSDVVSQSSIECPPLGTASKSAQGLELTGMSKNDETAEVIETTHILQSTLPKVRTNTTTTKHYSSLPCCGGERANAMDNKMRVGSCNGERNVLGIDISAVHNAVLAGGFAKLPEPIVNEHPVTIYPGPTTENAMRNGRPQRLMSSVEKHKEVCQIINPLSSISSTSSTTSSSSGSGSVPPISKLIGKDHVDGKRTTSPMLVTHSIATSSKTNAITGIAWEIHFESNKRHERASTGRKPLRKKHEEKGLRGPGSGGGSTGRKREIKKRESYDFDYDYDYDDAATPQILNYCMYRHQNMLGKGTFIIRKSTKKPTRSAMDIFKISPPPSPPSPPTPEYEISSCDESELKDSESIVTNEIYKKPNNIPNVNSTNCRHSFELLNSQNASNHSIASRDRLSLNIESQQSNALMPASTEMSTASSKSSKTSFEDWDSKCNKKILHQTISDNLMDAEESDSTGQEESLTNISKKSNANGFDRCTIFGAYKNNEIKSQEYPELRTSNTTTPHTDLAPTLEEDEEQLSDFSYGCAPLKQIENNISALLRGDIAVARVGLGNAGVGPGPGVAVTAGPVVGAVGGAGCIVAPTKRPLEFRPGVHKSESAKEMLLSQNTFGPLPPSPASSSPELFDYDAPLPPLPPSPTEVPIPSGGSYKKITAAVEVHNSMCDDDKRRNRDNLRNARHLSEELPLPPLSFDNLPPPPPAVPPHRGYSANTIKSWSIDSKYKRNKSPKAMYYDSGITSAATAGGPLCEGGNSGYSTKRYVSYGTKRSLKQSPREEQHQHRLQTSCSLPETPIFARGCDIPRTPYRRENENTLNGSRTAPRSGTSHSMNMGNSIVGISSSSAYGTGVFRQRSINHALASNEMLRLAGAPGRGWYPKQRSMRPASTEHIDRLATVRVWDSAAGMSGTGHTRKPLTLPPNLTPSFLNKSPREALRRVTSLLITKKKTSKERKNKPYSEHTMDTNNIGYDIDKSSTAQDTVRSCKNSTQKPTKKRGLFKNIWKKTKHFSLDQ